MLWDLKNSWIPECKYTKKKVDRVHRQCLSTFKDNDINYDVKECMRRTRINPVAESSLQYKHLNDKQLKKSDSYQMKMVKSSLQIERQNHNTLLRIMAAVVSTKTVQTIKSLCTLLRFQKFPPHKIPSRLTSGWDSGTLNDSVHKIPLREAWK